MTVREFCTAAFTHAGLDWRQHVEIDHRYERPAEVDALIGDASKAEQRLGWKAKTFGTALVEVMVGADAVQVGTPLEQMRQRLVRSSG